MKPSDRVILALDDPDLEANLALVKKLKGPLSFVKIGPVVFNRTGPTIINSLKDQGLRVFLDLKWHDIPNTVAGAIEAIVGACVAAPDFVTVHASGGEAMIRAARVTIDKLPLESRPKLLAVTVLTSLSQTDLTALGVSRSLKDQVEQLALTAISSRADGLVCSAEEVGELKRLGDNGTIRVVPGIRLDDSKGDQKRTATPEEAIRNGATHLVVGRAVSEASDPKSALENILQRIAKI